MTIYSPLPQSVLAAGFADASMPWPQKLLLTAVTVIAIVAATVSLSLNMVYSYSHAAEGMAAWMSALSALMLDLVKLTMTMLLPIWIKAGARLKVAFGLLTFTIMTACSLWFSFGFQSFSKADSHAVREHSQFTYSQKRSAYKDIQSKIAGLTTTRPVAVVMPDLDKARQHRRWRPSKGCTDVTLEKSRRFCNQYFELQKELATARERERLETKFASLRTSLDSKTSGKPTESTDPQTDIIKRLTGLSRKPILDFTTLMFAIAIELAASMAVFNAGWIWRKSGFRFSAGSQSSQITANQAFRKIAGPDQDTPTLYMRECLKDSPGTDTNATRIFEDYRTWCGKVNIIPVTQTRFGRAMKAAGYGKCKKSGRIYYRNIIIGDD